MMTHDMHPDGRFETTARYCDSTPYDLSNATVTACVDGFRIEKLSLSGFYDVVLPCGYYGVPGETAPDDPYAQKTVVTYGRVQQTSLDCGGVSYCATWFMDSRLPVLFLRLTAQSDQAFVLTYPFGIKSPQERLQTLCTGRLDFREREGDYAHYAAVQAASAQNKGFYAEITLAFNLGAPLTQATLKPLADDAEQDAEDYSRMLIAAAKPGEDAAFKSYSLNAAFSAYKAFGSFAGLFAGVAYSAPARTYYRDGYYTALALLPYRPDWVENELLTLARGIGADGSCGSAVDADGNPWWPGHADSPLFFALLLYAYVSQTGDKVILSKADIGDKLKRILERILSELDENGLLLRAPAHRHDWADNVFREGYVTYIECLAYGALRLGGSLLPDGARYEAAAERVKNGINALLWDETLGRYVNFACADETETNLSLDTVFAVLFGIAPENRAKRLLSGMERLLETQNNGTFGEFGVLCVYPPYRNATRLVEKSTEPLRYHNGAEWPYLSALYAFAKKLYGMDYRYPLTRWYTRGLSLGFRSPVEYFSPPYPAGGMLQAWSAFGAFVLDHDSAGGIFR